MFTCHILSPANKTRLSLCHWDSRVFARVECGRAQRLIRVKVFPRFAGENSLRRHRKHQQCRDPFGFAQDDRANGQLAGCVQRWDCPTHAKGPLEWDTRPKFLDNSNGPFIMIDVWRTSSSISKPRAILGAFGFLETLSLFLLFRKVRERWGTRQWDGAGS